MRMNESGHILETPLNRQADLADELADHLSRESVIRRNERLAKHTTLRVGGPAEVYVEPAGERDLALVLRFCRQCELPFLVIGRGSNLLVKDGGFPGVVICLAQPQFTRIEVAGQRLHCGAGARLKRVAVEAKRHGLAGLEFLEGIPGTVGGALRMNAGAMGGATFDVVESVRLMDYSGAAREWKVGELAVEYRSCPMLKTNIALSAVWVGWSDLSEGIEQRMIQFSRKRWNSQPAAPSAGCIFKNPHSIPAGRLIEELGLKGTRVGGALVSAEHGNFIVTDAAASAQDVLDLIDLVRRRVRAERGIELETEVEIVGQ